MIKLGTTERLYPWGVLRSTHASKVKFVLAEKGLPWEVNRIRPGDLWRKPPELLAKHPLGKVPWIEDEDALIWDSTVILEYLEERYPKPALLPSDAIARAEVRMMNRFVDEAVLGGDLPAIWMPWWSKEEDRDTAAMAKGRERLRQRALTRLETRLSDGREWLCNQLSMADAGLAAMAMVMQVDSFDLAAFPALDAYLKRLRERPAYLSISPETALENSASA